MKSIENTDMNNGETEQITGQLLNEKWQVNAKQAYYHEKGEVYSVLTTFPSALFDPDGYVLFPTEQEFRENSFLHIGEKINVPNGIAKIPGYVQAATQIVDDEDTREADTLKDTGSIYPYDMPKEVDIREDHLTIFEWLRKLNRKQLIIDPEFQRNLVWKLEQKSLFIESVLLNIPLPPLYINQSIEGTYIIVDGLQRTTTLADFVNNKFALTELQVLTELNDKKFHDLSEEYRTKLEDKKLLVYVIRHSVPLQMVYDIFHRINTGGTQLTRQEIRNCFYIGSATRLLKTLSERDSFRKAIGNGISPKRMKDREAVLRFLAFRIFDYKEDYKNDMDDFLGRAMLQINKMTESERIHLDYEFERAMKLTYQFFGDKNFRLPTESTRGQINIAILESVSYFFAENPDDFLLLNETQIKSNFSKLLKDSLYLDAVRFSTGDTRRVIRRFERAREILGDIHNA